MQRKIVHYLVPLFIFFYFALAFFPILRKEKYEIFPFFSFKLYSKVPNGFVRYDILYKTKEQLDRFLINKNTNLNKLQRKNYASQLNKMGSDFEKSGKIPVNVINDLLPKNGETAYLVKISGDCIKAVRDNDYTIEILSELK